MNSHLQRVTVLLPDDIYTVLVEEARTKEWTLSHSIRSALKRDLDRRRAEQLAEAQEKNNPAD